MSLRQREPRERDRDYCGWIAGLPCVACMVRGVFRRGVHVAHLRTGDSRYGKRATGGAEKPDDRWTLPLCPPHHLGDAAKRGIVAQHSMSEVEFYADLGIDPFQLCVDLRAAYAAGKPGVPTLTLAAARGRRHLEGSPSP